MRPRASLHARARVFRARVASLRQRTRHRRIGVAVVAALIAWAALLQVTLATFSSVTGSSGNSLTALSLNPFVPATAAASRTGPTACTVTWTASVAPGPPSGLRYDVTDGSGTTLATNVSGTTTSITVASVAITPTVKARVGTWLSSAATTASTACAPVPDAPSNVALTAGGGLLSASWTAPSGNGSAVTGYTVTATPSGGGAAVTCTPSPATSTTCTLTGLTDGTLYAVTVSATNANGAGPASAPVYGTPIAGRLLDGVTAPTTVAYSVRRLRAAYTGAAMTVRRASDSTTSVIGFDGSGDLDTAALLTFCAATSCSVTTWNDQSGAGKDLVQATPAAQPRIVSAGVLDAIGGRPTLVFSGAQQLRTATDAVPLGTTTVTANAVANGSGSSAGRIISFTGTGQSNDYGNVPSGELLRLGGTTTIVTKRNSVATSTAVTTTQLGSFTSVYDGTNALVYVGTTAGSSMASSGSFGATGTVNVGANVLADASSVLTGNVSELTMFASALGSTDRGVLAGGQSGYYLVPAAPTGVAATAADASSVVTWTAPALTGSTAITGYTVTAVPSDGTLANATCTAVAPATTCTLTGLTNGVTYTVSVTATNSSGTGPASASTAASTVIPYPATILSAGALKLWLDGAAPSTLLASSSCTGAVATSTVGCWTDKSTSANHFSQPTAGSRPGLATVASRSVPTFDGTTSSLLGGASTLPSGATASATFVVARMTDPTPTSSSYRTAFSWGTGTYNQTRSYQKDNLSASAVAVTWGGSGATAGSWPGNAWGLLDDAFSGSSYTADLNGISGSTISGSFSTGTTSAAVGTQLGLVGFWQGEIGEIAVLQGTLTATQRRTVQEYLARKWGITIVPAVPTGVTATAGDTSATLTWTAPSWNGGAAITGYTATAVPADGTLSTVTCTSASTGCTLTGLTNGVTYTVTVTATNAVGTGTASTAISVIPYPATVMTSSATKLWLDGADSSTLLASAGCTGAAATVTVGCWKDKSATPSNATQATGSLQPALSTSGSGSWNVPTYDGVDDTLAASASNLPTGTTPSTEFVVAKLTDPSPTTSGVRAVTIWGTAAATQARILNKLGNATTVNADTWSANSAQTGAWPSSANTIVAAEAATPTMRIAQNGKAWTTSSSAAFTTGTTGLAIGSTIGGGGAQWQGSVSEVVIVNTTLTTAQKRTVEEYLARKWGVAIPPSAPSALTGSVGDSQVTLTWSSPAWNGGATITGYTVTASPGGATCTATFPTTQCTVTGLTNGTAYTFTATATNAIGIGPASAATTTLTPPGPAGTPTGVTLTPGESQLAVSWTAPATGGPYTLYTVTGTPSDNTLTTQNCTATPPATTCTLTGLTNGVSYAVTVLATNAAGPGTATAPVSEIPYPASVMTSAATKLWLDAASTSLFTDTACSTAVTTAGQGVACWKDRSTAANNVKNANGAQLPATTSTGVGAGYAPAFDGTDDQLTTTTNNGMPIGTSDSTAFVVAKITAATPSSLGQRNLFRWGALSTTGAGRGLYLSSGAGGTNAGSTTMATDGSYTSNVAQISASVFSSGSSYAVRVGGRPTVSQSYAYSTGFSSITVGSASAPPQGPILEVVTLDSALSSANLRVIEEYLARKWSTQITPSAPSAATANGGNANATVSWTAPAWNGGATITGYTVTASPGGATCTATFPTTQCTVSGLTNGTAYTFTVTATNSVGAGPASAATASVTPFTSPSAPTGVTGTAGDRTVTVNWTAPSANGSAITGYTVTASPGGATCTSGAGTTTCTVTGLTNGTAYTFTVTATNAAGTGAASTASASVTPKAVLGLISGSAAAAYGLRKLSNSYAGSAITVRRSSDNTTQNIGFTAAGDLDTTALSSFCGAGSCYVTTWFDQSGNGRNATQATAANQPRIVNAGTTQTVNGRPAIRLVAASSHYLSMPSMLSGVSALTISAVAQNSSTGTWGRWFDFGTGTTVYMFATPNSGSADTRWIISTNSSAGEQGPTATATDNAQHTQLWLHTGTAMTLYTDGTSTGTATGVTIAPSAVVGGQNYLGKSQWVDPYLNGYYQEFVVLTSALSSTDRTTLTRDQGTYYSITTA